MIRTLRLRRFRGFENVSLPLNGLTVLLGPNSSGKSTFVSALVALREIHESKTGEPGLAPDGGRRWPVELGRYADLFNDRIDPKAGRDDVEIAVELASGWVEMGFGGQHLYRSGAATNDLLLTRLSLPGRQLSQDISPPASVHDEFIQLVQTTGAPTEATANDHRASIFERQNAEIWTTDTGQEVRLLFRGLVTTGAVLAKTGSAVLVETQAQVDLANVLGKLEYLRANRLMPARGWNDTDASRLGADGESTPQFLFHERARQVVDGTVQPPPASREAAAQAVRPKGGWFRSETRPLIDAVNYWLHHLALADAITSGKEGANIVLRARVPGQSRPRDLTDVGFGVSQVLPVIVAGLVTPQEGLLAVDQPESQLHPRSQAALADFLCMLVKTGRNVLVETHSEALFHRLRLRAAMDEEVASRTGVYFLDAPAPDLSAPRPISLSPDAALQWPEGFLAEGVAEEAAIRAVVDARGGASE